MMVRLGLVGVAMTVVMGFSAPRSFGEDKIEGAIWEIKFDAKDKKGPIITFRATQDGKIYDKGSGLIGSWTGDKDKAEMEITGLKEARFNGKYVLTNISKNKIPRWSGKFTAAGTDNTRDIAVKLIRD